MKSNLNLYEKNLLKQVKEKHKLCKKCLAKSSSSSVMLCNGLRIGIEKEEETLIPVYKLCQKAVNRLKEESFMLKYTSAGIPAQIVERYFNENSKRGILDISASVNNLKYSLDSFIKVQYYLIDNLSKDKSCRLLISTVVESVYNKNNLRDLIFEPEILVFVKYELLTNEHTKQVVVTALTDRLLANKQTILCDTFQTPETPSDYEYLDLKQTGEEVKF